MMIFAVIFVLSDSVHEFEITIKDLSRQQQELSAGRSQWQLERDSLQAALNEARDTIQALELKIESSNITIHQLKIEIENVTLGRNDEIENIR
jgi:chromosome segregation ATPase